MTISQPVTFLRVRRIARLVRRIAGARASKSLREFLIGNAIGA